MEKVGRRVAEVVGLLRNLKTLERGEIFPPVETIISISAPTVG